MDEFGSELETYLQEWQAWAASQDHGYAFDQLQPMHAGWKVPDEATLGLRFARLLHLTDQGHVGTVDNRKIALFLLKQPLHGVPILQVMQLRPGSSDPLGLDHVAFYCPDTAPLRQALEQGEEKWELQSNPSHQWLSMWFGPQQREAKFFDHTSLDLGAQELTEASKRIKRGSHV